MGGRGCGIEVLLDHAVESSDIQWFGQVVAKTCGPTALYVAWHGVGGDCDDGDPLEGLIGLQQLEQLVAIHARHVDIEQDKVWVACLC